METGREVAISYTISEDVARLARLDPAPARKDPAPARKTGDKQDKDARILPCHVAGS
jgi:hypothetical protein